MIDFSNYKFRASSIGKIMTDSRTKDPLGETCKKHLIECYVGAKYGRYKDITNKYIRKGLAVEEFAITLYANNEKRWFEKNETRMENEFICGTPDIIEKEAITDIKSSWDIHTFFNNFVQPMNKDYLYQLQSYMALTGKKNANLVYCLIDTPLTEINDAKRRIQWQMGIHDQDGPDGKLLQEAWEKIEREMTFSDIPESDRYIKYSFPFDEVLMDAVYERVKICRDFLVKLEESQNP